VNVKAAGSEADHAPPSTVGVKKKWSGTSTHPHAFKARVGTTVIFRRVPKLRKTTMRFVVSVRPRGTTLLPLDGFLWNFRFQ